MEKAVFGGGCFWCTEAVFKMLKGVGVVKPGYAIGEGSTEKLAPTYERVCSGRTDYAEVIYIEYDPNEVSFRDLLTVFFGSHDSTTINRQGNDIGPQYRSVVFYTTPEQRVETEKIIKEIDESNKLGDSVVTEVEPLGKFYEAEEYHKDYFERNKTQGYCQIIINPKLEKVQKEFADLLIDKENKK